MIKCVIGRVSWFEVGQGCLVRAGSKHLRRFFAASTTTINEIDGVSSVIKSSGGQWRVSLEGCSTAAAHMAMPKTTKRREARGSGILASAVLPSDPWRRVPTFSVSQVGRLQGCITSLVHTCAACNMAHDEVTKAQAAGPQEETIFGKILKGEIPCQFIYEDDKCVAFNDINPTAPVHFLVIPRKPITQLSEAKDEDEQILGHLLIVARKVAKERGLEEGFRVVINNGRHGCQSVYHIHLHVIGGRQLDWPPG